MLPLLPVTTPLSATCKNKNADKYFRTHRHSFIIAGTLHEIPLIQEGGVAVSRGGRSYASTSISFLAPKGTLLYLVPQIIIVFLQILE